MLMHDLQRHGSGTDVLPPLAHQAGRTGLCPKSPVAAGNEQPDSALSASGAITEAVGMRDWV